MNLWFEAQVEGILGRRRFGELPELEALYLIGKRRPIGRAANTYPYLHCANVEKI